MIAQPSSRSGPFAAALSVIAGFAVAAAIVAAVALADINCPTGANGRCNGNGQDNTMNGTNNYDDIHAESGADVAYAFDAGDDVIMGYGDDFALGYGGTDYITGDNTGDKRICNSGSGNYWCALEGNGGNDNIYGNDGDDVLRGDSGNDDLYGGPDSDIIDASNDSAGGDKVDGGGGYDYCYWNSGDTPIISCP